MPTGSTPNMLVVVDGHPSSAAGVLIADRYAEGAVALTGWEADTADLDAEVVPSAASEPTIDEALRSAAARRIAWIGLRRDHAEPRQLLSDLLISTARHARNDVPGFAVFLADGQPAPFRRMLAIVDRRSGPMSGLLAYVGIAAADRAGAELDILVIGADGEELNSDDERDMLEVSRERELYMRAVERGRESGITVNWLAATGSDPWPVIANQIAGGRYDLVIDDLGAVRLGQRSLAARRAGSALEPGQVGEIPLRLLTEVDIPLLLVIDEIRLGIAPTTMLKAGTIAAITLGVIPGMGIGLGSSAVASASPPARTMLAEAIAVQLSEALEEDTDSRDRAAGAASRSKRSAADSDEDKAEAPKVPKGGATPKDVEKAKKKAAKEKADLAKEKAAREKAAAKQAKAEEGLDEATTEARAALTALTAATESYDEALSTARQTEADSTGINLIIPGGATKADAAVAAQAELEARFELDLATATGEETLTALEEAEERLAKAEERLAEERTDTAAAKADYEAAKEQLATMKKSLATTRQSPVKKGNYRLTARFGQSGGRWSSGRHTGLDFAGRTGTDIKAAASGTVVKAGYDGAYGNCVEIKHANGWTTVYAHLSDIDVRKGQKVQTGDQIGDMGSTGNSTGPHLHFEVKKGDTFVDPEAWLGW